jgi:hypothetical protein
MALKGPRSSRDGILSCLQSYNILPAPLLCHCEMLARAKELDAAGNDPSSRRFGGPELSRQGSPYQIDLTSSKSDAGVGVSRVVGRVKESQASMSTMLERRM